MAFIDYYKVLEMDKGDGSRDKKTYRKMARKYHPI
jgi:DnaJ-class molecular chaperone